MRKLSTTTHVLSDPSRLPDEARAAVQKTSSSGPSSSSSTSHLHSASSLTHRWHICYYRSMRSTHLILLFVLFCFLHQSGLESRTKQSAWVETQGRSHGESQGTNSAWAFCPCGSPLFQLRPFALYRPYLSSDDLLYYHTTMEESFMAKLIGDTPWRLDRGRICFFHHGA